MKTTFGRTFSTAATILLLALLLLGTTFQYLVQEFITEKTISELENDAEMVSNLAAAYSLDGSLTSRDFLLNLDVAAKVSGSDAVICSLRGEVLLCSDALFGCEHQGMFINNAEYLKKVIEGGGDVFTGVIDGLYQEPRYVVSKPILSADNRLVSGIVIVSTPTAATNALMKRISNIFLSAAAAVVLIAVLAVSLFARQQSRPLRDLSKAAYAFGHGDLDARVRLSGDYSQEMEELALSFNNMASLLQKSEYQRQEFVANVSHELKTPMTTISGYVDGILDGTIPEHRQEYYLQIVSDETKRLSRLVRSMLDISRLQDQPIPEEQKMHFDLEEALGQVLITFEQKILGKELDVEVDLPGHPVFTFAGKDYVTQVIYNLIDNAVKFCPQGGTLGVRIKEAGRKAYVTISNNGETIPPDELPLVFDRFHKLDKARTRTKDSWGLGLYIVKTIVCSHGENISVASKNGKTEFTFTMPLVN
ncbi:MAG: HAMP domain-containing histidine kinase [Oscillospiraceae bacterium]|nr:HAMP domain-containing histidine kinase [Oscillospiraceae bacterium]